MKFSFRGVSFIFLFWIGLSASVFGGDPRPERVLVLANSLDRESVALADHYAEKRSIPRANVIALPLPSQETISIETFVRQIFNPLRARLLADDWIRGVPRRGSDPYGRDDALILSHRIDYLVLCKGVPLRIANDPERTDYAPAEMSDRLKVNQASVDSELALLAAPLRTMIFHLPNPLFEQRSPSINQRHAVVRVSRLDGPSYADARRLVDNALAGEARGLHGRSYIDARGPHAAGDEWLEAAAGILKEHGFDTELRAEPNQARRTDLRDWRQRLDGIAFYLGWYQQNAYGPFLETRLRPQPGAIGFHLHSFSATTVRRDDRGWVGPLVARGFTATVGNVYEPYLEFTHRPQLFVEALLRGQTWGEAVFYSLPVLSWQGIAVGDPLYRPFGRPLEESLVSPDGEHQTYAYIRRMNQLNASDAIDEAIALGRQGFIENPSLPLALHLARFAVEAQNLELAKRSLDFSDFITVVAPDQALVVKEIADLLIVLGETQRGMALYDKLIGQRDLPAGSRETILAAAADHADANNNRSQAVRLRSELTRLRAGN